MSLDRTAVRLKGSPLGAGRIREIRRGRLLWRADLFNHVRHSGLSFCPFYYDILAPSSALMSLSHVSVCDPSALRLCAGFSSVCWSWGSWHARTTHNQRGKSSLDCIMSIFWGWANGIKSLELLRDSLKRNSLSPISFSLTLSPLYHQISFCKRIS